IGELVTELTNSPIYQFTNSPVYQLTNCPYSAGELQQRAQFVEERTVRAGAMLVRPGAELDRHLPDAVAQREGALRTAEHEERALAARLRQEKNVALAALEERKVVFLQHRGAPVDDHRAAVAANGDHVADAKLGAARILDHRMHLELIVGE